METKKPTAKTPEAQVIEIEKGLVPLKKEAQKIVIKTADDAKGATSFLAKVKGYADRVNELQTFFTEPYVEQRRVALEKKQEIEKMFAPKLLPLNDILVTVKRTISDYTLEEERKARAEEERKQKIRDVANAKREKKEGRGQIIEPVKTVERAAATMKTEEGRTTTKKVWKFEIIDAELLKQNAYFGALLVDLAIEKGLHEQLLRHMVATMGVRELEGVRIYEDINVSVSAN